MQGNNYNSGIPFKYVYFFSKKIYNITIKIAEYEKIITTAINYTF